MLAQFIGLAIVLPALLWLLAADTVEPGRPARAPQPSRPSDTDRPGPRPGGRAAVAVPVAGAVPNGSAAALRAQIYAYTDFSSGPRPGRCWRLSYTDTPQPFTPEQRRALPAAAGAGLDRSAAIPVAVGSWPDTPGPIARPFLVTAGEEAA
ncbi:hypothetical protein [Nocardiopsis ansamitocini]|uniref:Uncharacterized protein n=1 Tax=Nocardiopsis ansamitocini TaxID=1670832 RepID=A0A9W6UIE3_9ACTN|nr:hypothetical protein [Nocardiopsis ansamitocini]GLU46970.1 hypothetical protein Nans01_13210 [Nocardiopsis ansamitocini]